jgi:hypothetical protein
MQLYQSVSLPSSAKAKPQLQLSFKAELALILLFQHPPTHPPARPSRLVVIQLEISKTGISKIAALSQYDVGQLSRQLR